MSPLSHDLPNLAPLKAYKLGERKRRARPAYPKLSIQPPFHYSPKADRYQGMPANAASLLRRLLLGACIAYVPFAAGCFQTKWPNTEAAKVMAQAKAEPISNLTAPSHAQVF